MRNMVVVIAIFLAFFIIAISNFGTPSGKWYNCRDVDFLPDIPPRVKEECRRIIKERLDEQKKQETKNIVTT